MSHPLSLDELARRFGGKREGSGFRALCPCHDDHDPSLSIFVGNNDRPRVCCLGCSASHVDLGRSARPPVKLIDGRWYDAEAEVDWRGNGQTRRIVHEYDYADENGVRLFQVVRYSPKGFSQRRPDGHGSWIKNIKGVRRVLYRLPELIEAPQEATIFVVEGEKDADRLAAAGLVATCCPGGAGKWSHVHDNALEGRHVVIVPDNDDAGRRHAEDVARRLYGRADPVRVLAMPNLADGQDVSDWLDAGGDTKELDRLVAAAAEWSPAPAPVLEPYRDSREAMQAARRMAKTAEELLSTAGTLADQAAEWFDRRGDEKLEKEYPVAYVAAMLGIGRQHFYYLRDVGRVQRELRLSGAPDTSKLSDRARARLAKLLPDQRGGRPDRRDRIPEVFQAAGEIAHAEGKRRISGTHTARALAELVPECRTVSYNPDESPRQLFRQINHCYDLASSVPGCPRAIVEGLQAAQYGARRWAEGREQ